MENDKSNTADQDAGHAEYEFKFNFINMPWDDRTTKSKIGIVSLLVAIFAATMAVLGHNFYVHYNKTPSGRRGLSNEIKCHLVKPDLYPFAALIYSIETKELLCVGAMVGHQYVLANGVCAKAGPVRIHLGHHSSPRCKKGFTVGAVVPIHHDGTVAKRLVLMATHDSMAGCGHIIQIGDKLDFEEPAYIIGRPLSSGKLLSRQPAELVRDDKKSPVQRLTFEKTICVTGLAKCPVKAGDLLVQNEFIYGLASTSIHITESSKTACFADLRLISDEIKQY